MSDRHSSNFSPDILCEAKKHAILYCSGNRIWCCNLGSIKSAVLFNQLIYNICIRSYVISVCIKYSARL